MPRQRRVDQCRRSGRNHPGEPTTAGEGVMTHSSPPLRVYTIVRRKASASSNCGFHIHALTSGQDSAGRIRRALTTARGDREHGTTRSGGAQVAKRVARFPGVHGHLYGGKPPGSGRHGGLPANRRDRLPWSGGDEVPGGRPQFSFRGALTTPLSRSVARLPGCLTQYGIRAALHRAPTSRIGSKTHGRAWRRGPQSGMREDLRRSQ